MNAVLPLLPVSLSSYDALPTEAIEMILQELPAKDLWACRTFGRRWAAIVRPMMWQKIAQAVKSWTPDDRRHLARKGEGQKEGMIAITAFAGERSGCLTQA